MLIHVLSFSVVLILQASSIKDAKPFLFKSVSKHSLAVSHFLVVSLLWSLALSPGSPGVSPPWVAKLYIIYHIYIYVCVYMHII